MIETSKPVDTLNGKTLSLSFLFFRGVGKNVIRSVLSSMVSTGFDVAVTRLTFRSGNSIYSSLKTRSFHALLVWHPLGLRFGTSECFRFNKDILGFFQLQYKARGVRCLVLWGRHLWLRCDT